MQFQNIIVTGASSGIGRAVAEALAGEHVNLFLCARNAKKLEETAGRCRSRGIRCETFSVDLGQETSTDRILPAALRALGDVDALVSCAGVYPLDGVDQLTPALWDQVMDLNLRSTFFLSRNVLSHLKKKQAGYLIFINSTVALGAKPSVTAYSVSKYALEGAAAALYEDAKQHHVRVSSVYPGVTNTETLRREGMPCAPDQCMLPEDIARCVTFLLNTPPRMVVKDIIPWATAYDQI